MNDWSHGYSAASGYTFGGYRELSPEWLDAVAILSNCAPPRMAAAKNRFRYLELGCGQGFGLVLLAACYPDAEFVGIDFAPDHIAHGRDLAAAAQMANVQFIEGDFADLAGNWPSEWRDFDYVVLHGIYSWVSSELRESLRSILKQSTAPGGLVYLSYNSLPGRLTMLPFHHITRALKKGRRMNGPDALRESIGLFQELDAGSSAMHKALPTLGKRVSALVGQDVDYLQHEYLHDNWDAFWFSQVNADMAEAKLSFLGSATLVEMMTATFMQGTLKTILDRTADPVLRQDIMDCAINQTFRRDVYIRGRRAETGGLPGGHSDIIFYRLQPCDEKEIRIKTSFADLGLSGDSVRSLLSVFDDGPRTLAQIVEARKDDGHPLKPLLLLVEKGMIGIGRGAGIGLDQATRLNRMIMALAEQGAPYRRLAAGALGSTISASLADMLLLGAYLDSPDMSGDMLVDRLIRQYARLGVEFKDDDGAKISANGVRPHVRALVDEMFKAKLPVWSEIGIF